MKMNSNNIRVHNERLDAQQFIYDGEQIYFEHVHSIAFVSWHSYGVGCRKLVSVSYIIQIHSMKFIQKLNKHIHAQPLDETKEIKTSIKTNNNSNNNKRSERRKNNSQQKKKQMEKNTTINFHLT